MKMVESTKKQNNAQRQFYRRIYIIASLAIPLFIIAALVFILLTQKQKPDPDSETIFRQVVARNFLDTGLKIDPNKLTDEDFAKIDNLEVGMPVVTVSGYPAIQEIPDIMPLEKFKNLRYLSLGAINYPSNKIPKWMSLLAKYGVYNLEEKFALDLSPLKKLNNLEVLVIFTTVKNFKPLESLANLQELWLSSSRDNKLDHLKNLTKLKTLIIFKKQVSDLEPLKGLKNLQRLFIVECDNISDEEVEDLQKALPNLEISRKKEDAMKHILKTYDKMFW